MLSTDDILMYGGPLVLVVIFLIVAFLGRRMKSHRPSGTDGV